MATTIAKAATAILKVYKQFPELEVSMRFSILHQPEEDEAIKAAKKLLTDAGFIEVRSEYEQYAGVTITGKL